MSALSGRLAAGIIALAALFPLVAPNTYYLSVASLAMINALAAVGLNLIAGYAGQLNLAHAGFMAIGAYALAILTMDAGVPYWLAFLLSGAVAGVLGLAVGLVSLRLRGHFFAIFTLCVGTVLFLVIEKWDALTRGVVGIMDIPRPPPLGPVRLDGDLAQYYLVTAVLAMGLFVMARITGSLIGRTYAAVRLGADLAEALGINLMRTKLAAFVVSTVYAGIAGALYAGYVRFLGPDLAHTSHTFDMITFILVGGIGTLAGPLVGALVVSVVVQSLGFLQDMRMLVFGPLLILLIIFYPHGLVGALENRAARRRAAAAEPT